MVRLPFLVVLGLLSVALPLHRAGAVILRTGEAPATPPTGRLADSGWQWQIGPTTCGTLVGPSHILTATHLGLWKGSRIQWNGLDYVVVEAMDHPDSDLRLLKVGGRFSTWAPMNRTTTEVRKEVVVFGRGGPPGAPVVANNKVCGWNWNPPDGQLRWGTNQIDSVVTGNESPPGHYIIGMFDEKGGNLEATFSVGDSGGGVFLQTPTGWALAGVISAVQGTFKATADGPLIYAALFDRRPFLEEMSPGVWDYDPNRYRRAGTFWMASRISAYAFWIDVRMSEPPQSPTPRLMEAPSAEGPFQEVAAYAVDPGNRRIQAPHPGRTSQFYRIEGDGQLRMESIGTGFLFLRY
jgi:hypothetical protein